MKKYIFGGIAAMALLSSCSESVMTDEVISSDAIAFNVLAENSSRAVTSFCNYNMPDTFCVYAKTTEGVEYLKALKVEKQGSQYVFADGITHYWPQSALNFTAYAHDMAEPTYNRALNAFVNYTIEPAAENQLDLVYATALNKTKANGTVKLNFRHALSQAIFRAQVVNKNIRVEIKSVALGGIDGKGTFTLPTAESTDGIIGPNHNDNSQSENTKYPGPTTGLGAWSALTNPGEFTATLASAVNVNYNTKSTTVLTASPTNHPANGNWSGVLSLIPQRVAAWNPETKSAGSYIKVNCDIYNVATDGDVTNEVLAHQGDIYIPMEVIWEQGVRYIYTLTFGSGSNAWTDPEDPEHALIPVTADVEVDDFLPQEVEETTVEKVVVTYAFTVAYIYSKQGYSKSFEYEPDADHCKEIILPTYEEMRKYVGSAEGFSFGGWAVAEPDGKGNFVRTKTVYQPGDTYIVKNHSYLVVNWLQN